MLLWREARSISWTGSCMGQVEQMELMCSTVHCLQQTVDRMPGKVDAVLPHLKQLTGQLDGFSTEFERKLLDVTELVHQ